MWRKNISLHFLCDYYETSYVLYNALYFILIEHSEVKLRLFLKIRYEEEKLRKSHKHSNYSFILSVKTV